MFIYSCLSSFICSSVFVGIYEICMVGGEGEGYEIYLLLEELGFYIL